MTRNLEEGDLGNAQKKIFFLGTLSKVVDKVSALNAWVPYNFATKNLLVVGYFPTYKFAFSFLYFQFWAFLTL